MADFKARIEAIADLSKATNDLNAFVNQKRQIIINPVFQFNQAQQSLNGLARQMQQQGASAGAQFTQAFTSSLNKIDLRNGGVGNIQRMLQGAGFDRSSIALVTKEFDKMSLSIGKIQTKQLKNGNIRMNISGVDDLQRSVTLVEDFNNKTGKISTASKTFTQN